MSNISDYLETEWLKTMRGGGAGTSYTAPSVIYVQLHTNANSNAGPGDAGTNNISAIHTSANTARAAITFNAPSGGTMTITTGTTVDFTNWPSAGNTETIAHVSLWDATGLSGGVWNGGGNCLWNGSLTGGSKTMATGDTLSITALTLTLG